MELIRPTSSVANPFTVKGPVESPRLDLEDLYCILQIQPHDSFMAFELGRRLRALGRNEEALRILRSVVDLDSNFFTVHELGQLEYQMDYLEASFAHLQEALLIAPENAREFFDLFKTLGNIFVRTGDLDSAEDSYHKAFRLHPESDVLLVNFGTLNIQREMWDSALGFFRQALSLNPANDKAWVGLGLCHRRKGDVELAWGNIEAALEHNPLNEVALGLALEWGAQERRELRALEYIRRFLIEGGWNEKMSLAFVWLSWRKGELNLARFELERLLAVNPDNVQAHQLLLEMRGQN